MVDCLLELRTGKVKGLLRAWIKHLDMATNLTTQNKLGCLSIKVPRSLKVSKATRGVGSFA